MCLSWNVEIDPNVRGYFCNIVVDEMPDPMMRYTA